MKVSAKQSIVEHNGRQTDTHTHTHPSPNKKTPTLEFNDAVQRYLQTIAIVIIPFYPGDPRTILSLLNFMPINCLKECHRVTQKHKYLTDHNNPNSPTLISFKFMGVGGGREMR